jgi:hypothetical protein
VFEAREPIKPGVVGECGLLLPASARQRAATLLTTTMGALLDHAGSYDREGPDRGDAERAVRGHPKP